MRARRGSPDPAARSTESLPNGRNGSERAGDLRSGQAAGSGDPRQAQSATGKITGHWGEDAVGFKWTEQDSVDNRLQQMDVGRFYSATIWTPKEMTLKGIAVRIGDKSEASVLFDTELLRVVCGWSGEFLEFNPARYGIIGPPKVGKEIAFHSPRQPGWAGKEGGIRKAEGGTKDRSSAFPIPTSDFPKFGPLPREWAKYRGLHLHGDRVVFEYIVGPKQVAVLESPWVETIGDRKFVTRELEVAPSETELELLVAEGGAKVELVADAEVVTLNRGDEKTPITVKIVPHDKVVRLKLLFPIDAKSATSVLKKEDLETQSSQRSLKELTQPGPARWTHEITTRGVVSDKADALAVDTLNLPFDNPYKALMFVGGHDFFVGQPFQADRNASPTSVVQSESSDIRVNLERMTYDAAVCTLHGDVWLVSGIDDKLEKLTWKRFATGLFQPLGLKIVKNEIYVVGRDQITRLHDLNGDGEADWYENFNNDGQVTANGHEYVTCLETDRDGWFYFLKGNADGKTDHDGCLLRVSPDGQKLEVVATGFRNANGLGMGLQQSIRGDVITVAPQEGEWTPASGIFQVRPGHFYGYVPSAHRPEVPKRFTQPLCWIPRLQDNSSGGQVWVPHQRWGHDGQMVLHLSYGTSRAFLFLIEEIYETDLGIKKPTVELLLPPDVVGDKSVTQGGTVPLPLALDSGVMRGRFRDADGQLYVSGLRGWVSNAAKDGCLQRVRYTGRPLELPVEFETYRDGVLLTFSNPIDEVAAGDPENYRVEQWNYRWSAAYGSPEFQVSNPTQEGRDEVEVLSATPIGDGGAQMVFLELKDFQPVDQLSIQMTLKAKDGRPLDRRIDYTIHAIQSKQFHDKPTVAKRRPGQLTETEQERLVPGIRCEFVGQVENLPHVRRMAAWRFEPHEVAATREIVANGFLVAPRRGKYQLSAEGSGATEISIGDRVVWRSTEDKPSDVELARGYNRLRIVQSVDGKQLEKAVSLRLLWESDSFETEPVPPTALFCERLPESVVSQELGRKLFGQHLCARCHTVGDEVLRSRSAMPELQIEAPDLIGVGSRLTDTWMYQWLLDPTLLRSAARMPRLFSVNPSEEERQQAADVVEYLSSLKLPPPPRPPVTLAPPISARDLALGNALWEDLGCIGCHRREYDGNDQPTDGRFSLIFAYDKFVPGELTKYLFEPHRHFAWTRMPTFALSENEARSLAHAVIESAKQDDKRPELRVRRPKGDVARGQKLLASLGCRQCHRVSRDEPMPKPHLPSVFGKAIARGCLGGTDEHRSPRSPDFHLKPAERTALLALLRGTERQLASDTPTDVSRRFVAELKCAVCHPRDGRVSSLPEILAEEGASGRPPEVLPNLTWVGEKLHSPWIQTLLAGQIAERPRPWMKLRMPSFPARAGLLADGFAREHGLSSDPSPRPSVEPDLAEIGEALATRAGLLDCRQCHAIGSLQPTGDKSTLLAPGINFALTRERIREDFYRRFTLDPPRYDVTTRMPKLVVDGRTTKVKNVFDGDARQQFDAVWHYLQTVPSSTADP